MNIIGRKIEQQKLRDILDSKKAEFVVVYGRRRVGKTFLIKEFFDNRFSFYATGVNDVSLSDELSFFEDSLRDYGDNDTSHIKSWREAFLRLKRILQNDSVSRDPASGKKIVFLDELPWMDTPKSGFKPALDHFWNSWASTQDDIVLITCGSATSWIIGNILTSRSGFYNRVTAQIHLMPFSIRECKSLFAFYDIPLTQNDILVSYMIFGGIPYYLSLFSKRLSLAQNIDNLIFNETGQLHYEYRQLFDSLFRSPGKHREILKALTQKRMGLSRKEIIKETKIADGALLTKALTELEQCGFIRRYKKYTMDKKDAIYQLIDPFLLFSYTFLESGKISSWLNYIHTPGYNAWCGLAFELVCLNHIDQIKHTLGIAGVETSECSWRSKKSSHGAQIDLLIDRADNVINICEIKYSTGLYTINSDYAKELENKLDVFQNETQPKKALHLTMICSNGLKHNEYSSIAVNEITSEDLF